jgi:hypothetical protein
MKKIDIRHFSHLEKLATLTHLYLELRLSLAEALRAAKADLQMDSLPYATQQVLKQHAFLEQRGDVHPGLPWDYHRNISSNLAPVKYSIKSFP